MLRSVDRKVSTGTPCDVLCILDGTSRKIVEDAVELYDSTDSGQLQLALERLSVCSIYVKQWTMINTV
jgi:hypothetical protein